MNRAAAAAGLGVAAAVAVATIAARHAEPSVVSPLTPPGGWRAAWVAAVAAAFVLAVCGWLLARRGGLPLRLALALAVVVQCVPLAGPLLLSKDVYSYWNGARLVAVHGANPYVDTPSEFPDDVSYAYTAESWRPYAAPYGPAWEALALVPAAAAGGSAATAQRAFRVLAVLGVLAIVAVAAWRTRSAAAVALVGWSPLVALHYAGGGHADAWMTALLAFAIAAPSGAAWAFGAAFKPVPAILLPLELARTRGRLPRRWWAGLAAAVVVIAVGATAAWGLHWFSGTARGVHQVSSLGGVHWLTELGLRHRYAVVVGALVFVAVYLVLLREAWLRGRARFALAATALCLTSSLLNPWYGLWPLALAALELDLLSGAAALALSAYLLLDAIPR